MKLVGSMSKFLTVLFTLAIVFAIGTGLASASPKELSKKEKEALHQQYVEIVKEVVAEHEGTEMEVVPFKKFADEDWIEPEAFRQLAVARAKLMFNEVVDNEFGTFAVSATKTKTINSNGADASISITDSFNTYYNSASNRQLFSSSINSLTSKTTSGGSWTQTGYTPRLIDGGRTYAITVGGKYTINSLTSSHNIPVEFYCNTVGSVS
ncbi:hypothetical protein ACOI1C_12380 [Bacillus sp. DJP31]|uniref:hypothetical protein n=1 Tax=Bacillus sp. DJP31 TaxID=3409789 RepID=UPI003BB7EE6F